MNNLIAFEPGKSYFMRSVCDHECIWTYNVVARTARFVTLVDQRSKEHVRAGVRVWEGVEQCMPLGSYSMAPRLCADKVTS